MSIAIGIHAVACTPAAAPVAQKPLFGIKQTVIPTAVIVNKTTTTIAVTAELYDYISKKSSGTASLKDDSGKTIFKIVCGSFINELDIGSTCTRFFMSKETFRGKSVVIETLKFKNSDKLPEKFADIEKLLCQVTDEMRKKPEETVLDLSGLNVY